MSDIHDKMAEIAVKSEQAAQLHADLQRSINMRDLLKEHNFGHLEGAVRVGPCTVGHRPWRKRNRDGSILYSDSTRRGLGTKFDQNVVLSIKCDGVEIMLNAPIPFEEWELKYGPIRPKR